MRDGARRRAWLGGTVALVAACGVGGRGGAVATSAAPPSHAHAFVATFRSEGVTLDRAARPWSVTLGARRYGCAGDLRPLAAAPPEVRADRVEYRRVVTMEGPESPAELPAVSEASIVEWYVDGPLGLEQGFTLSAPPPCAGPIAIETAVSGLAPVSAGGRAAELRDGDGRLALRYTGLSARDARGREVPARIEVGAGRITIHVDAEGAAYPLVVDPMLQTEDAKLIPAEAMFGDGAGTAVAISGDTAVLGAPQHPGFSGPGAAFVFVKNASGWTEQQVLSAPDGKANDAFGSAVAISGDTLVVGAYDHAVGAFFDAGAAYVFVRSGGVWSLQQELQASDLASSSSYGAAVAISGDTLVVGEPEHHPSGQFFTGAAYVLTRSGTTWTEQQILVAADGAANDQLGFAVAVDGTTALIGAPAKTVGGNAGAGAAYVFVQSGATWTQQQEITAADGAAFDELGQTVALDGDTALIGALNASPGGVTSGGAVYVEVRSGVAWSLQQKLVASDEAPSDFFGSAVGVAGDTALVGASQHTVAGVDLSGAAYAFTRSGTQWTQGNTLTASDRTVSDNFGHAAALDGITAVVGAYVHASQKGQGYVFTVDTTTSSTSGAGGGSASSSTSSGGAGGGSTSSSSGAGGAGGGSTSSSTSSNGAGGGVTSGATSSVTSAGSGGAVTGASSSSGAGGATAGATSAGSGGASGVVSQPGGCGCTVPGSAGGDATALLGEGLLFAGLLFAGSRLGVEVAAEENSRAARTVRSSTGRFGALLDASNYGCE